jgi:hypothetical protein
MKLRQQPELLRGIQSAPARGCRAATLALVEQPFMELSPRQLQGHPQVEVLRARDNWA